MPSNLLAVAAAVGATSIVLLSGACGGDGDPTISSSCAEAMRAAANEPNPARAEPPIEATLTDCATADEWLAALARYPSAMGLTEDAEIGNVDLQAACGGNPSTPVCEDAADHDRL